MTDTTIAMQRATRHPLAEVGVQAALITGAALVYFAVRGATEGSVARANMHGHDLLRLEAFLGIDVEARLQGLILDSEVLSTAFNWVYIWGHWPAIAVTLVWLHQRAPEQFVQLRNALFVSGAIGVVIFVLYPVTPPRLLDVGIVDTVTEQSNAYRLLQPPSLINKYAALPSLHVGWNFLIGLAIFITAQRRWLKVLGVLSPIAMIAAVVLTGNHYVIDAVAGIAIASVGWIIAARLFPGDADAAPPSSALVVSTGAKYPTRGCLTASEPDRRVVCPSASCSLHSASDFDTASTGITSRPSPTSAAQPPIDDGASFSR